MLISSLTSRRFGTRVFHLAKRKGFTPLEKFSLTRILKKQRRSLTGFTLIELLVVSAIVLIITSLVLVRQSRFDSTSLLRSLTYSVALSVRQAQAYGISARESAPGSGSFSKSYGIHFADGSTDNYVLFADLNLNGVYDVTPTDELVQRFKLAQGYRLNRTCAKQVSGGTIVCLPTLSYVNVYFRRPNPDALFRTSASGQTYSDAYVELISGGGDTRAIKVTSAGQITVCPVNQDTTFSTCQ